VSTAFLDKNTKARERPMHISSSMK